MNKKGQTLIMFIILIPMVLFILAIIVDLGVVINKKINLREVTKEVIIEGYDKDDDTIKELFIKNKVDINNLKIIREGNSLKIENEEKVKSIFGAIIGIKEYKIKIDITGYKINQEIKFE